MSTSCLNITVTRVSDRFLGSIHIRGGAIQAETNIASPETTVEVSKCTSRVLVSLNKLCPKMTCKCTLICSLEKLHYLNISPSEVQWVTPDYGVIYNIYSNTEWIIVTS